MKITATVLAGLVAGTLVTANPAQAEVTVPPALTPVLKLQADPKAEVQELLRQISELDDQWGALTPAERNQRSAGFQQQVTIVDRESHDLPPEQRPEVQALL